MSAIAGEHIGDPALPHRDQIGLVDPIGEWKEKMDAAAQDFLALLEQVADRGHLPC